MDREKVVLHYLTGWFTCDVLSSIPWAMIASGFNGQASLILVHVSSLATENAEDHDRRQSTLQRCS